MTKYILATLALVATIAPAAALRAQQHGVRLDYRDTTCAACTAFYEFANGAWIRRAPAIGPDGALGTIQELDVQSHAVMRRILDSLASPDVRSPSPLDSNSASLRLFYTSCVDAAHIEALGIAPLDSEIHRIEGIRSIADLVTAAARLQRQRISAIFLVQALPAPRDARHVVADLRPLGLGLGDRNAYLQTDSASVAQLARYAKQLERTFVLAGNAPALARDRAARVLKVETVMAAWSLPMMDRMDPSALDHPMSRQQLDSVTPRWSWTAYFTALGKPDIGRINVEEPVFLQSFAHALDSIPLEDWRAYVLWRFMQSASRDIGGPAVDSLLGDYGRGKLRAQSDSARRDYCVDQTEQRLGWVLGRLYVAREFTPAARARARQMVENIRAELRSRIDSATWMGAATRAEARRKLAAYTVQIGYPDRWPNYSGATLSPREYWKNIVVLAGRQTDIELARIGKPADPNDWPPGYWPQVNDAFFNPNLNEIGLAAGYLQPPMFDVLADDPTNYGAFGAVIAHEMTHAFDDQGRKFDARGNLRDWWTPSDDSAYHRLTRNAIAQFDAYTVADSTHINGRRTLNENLADIGGLQLAFAAFERTLPQHSRNLPDAHGVTPEQRFFLAYAQSRRGVFGPAYLEEQVLNNNHSPDKWRVIGALANMPEFARAFHCAAEQSLVLPEDRRVHIW